MVKVKICGITNLEDAQVSVKAGCDALGFVFYRRSPRYISPEKAKSIIANISGRATKIGVFVNSKEERIKNIAKSLGLDILQFHGKESPDFCAKFKGYKIIKTFRVRDRIERKQLQRYRVFAYLFDTFVSTKAGGTGKVFNWQLVKHLKGIKRPIFLSGGLTEDNVATAIKAVKPGWVDVSSSVESRPGKKDYKKVIKFIEAAKKVNR